LIFQKIKKGRGQFPAFAVVVSRLPTRILG
jgi:hypothetical protein